MIRVMKKKGPLSTGYQDQDDTEDDHGQPGNREDEENGEHAHGKAKFILELLFACSGTWDRSDDGLDDEDHLETTDNDNAGEQHAQIKRELLICT